MRAGLGAYYSGSSVFFGSVAGGPAGGPRPRALRRLCTVVSEGRPFISPTSLITNSEVVLNGLVTPSAADVDVGGGGT